MGLPLAWRDKTAQAHVGANLRAVQDFGVEAFERSFQGVGRGVFRSTFWGGDPGARNPQPSSDERADLRELCKHKDHCCARRETNDERNALRAPSEPSGGFRVFGEGGAPKSLGTFGF